MKIPSTINAKAFLGLETLERIRKDRALAGICTAISELTGIRLIKIRILTLTLMGLDSSGGIFCLYILFWLILPLREKPVFDRTTGADELKTVSMVEVYKDR
jgi:phage shock protein PspC (stress-responsive transcriptional regulator)